jgi:ferredoxin
MMRKIIHIDESRCNGCGLCVSACHEGAIGLVDGKAKLLRDDYCDGLGNCLPVCPTGAITFEEREALAYNETAVKKNMEEKGGAPLACGCPGTSVKSMKRDDSAPVKEMAAPAVPSQLRQWPVQLKLIPVNAPYFENANLLVSADCAAYAYGNFHHDYMRNKITVIGCPKLDNGDYSEKLAAILKQNNIKSVTVVRMEVPCCGGIENAVKAALQSCGKMIPWQVITVSADGTILEN